MSLLYVHEENSIRLLGGASIKIVYKQLVQILLLFLLVSLYKTIAFPPDHESYPRKSFEDELGIFFP